MSVNGSFAAALLPGLAVVLGGQPVDRRFQASFEGRPAYVLSNPQLELTILAEGGAFASLALAADPQRLSPLWKPARAGPGRGHFVCVDGFGDVSPEERVAGLPPHGEAHTLPWAIQSESRDGATSRVTFTVDLPRAGEVFTRTVRMVDGESVVYVESELESLLAFDRPINWAEHATIGSPFLEPGTTVVDWPAVRSMTRPDAALYPDAFRFPPGKEFAWPTVTLRDGSVQNIRSVPASLGVTDHDTNLLDPARKYVFATALNTRLRMIIGWVFKPEEYPWLQDWESYGEAGKLARGLEFATQPFDVPRREAIQKQSLFGAPTYRWLPAKSKIGSRFLIFLARAPEGMQQVDEVKLEGGQLVVEDHKSGRQMVLAASRGL